MIKQPQNLSLYKKILYTERQVNARITQMAAEASMRYIGRNTIFVSLLNGAAPFTAKFMSAIQRQNPHFHPNAQSMIISRYGPNREPGETRVVTDLPPEYRKLNGRHVVIIDDLIDGGGTTEFAKQHLYNYGADKVEIIVLVKKQKNPPIGARLAMYGFDAPDAWLTGMGMDDDRLGNEANRWAGWIAIAND